MQVSACLPESILGGCAQARVRCTVSDWRVVQDDSLEPLETVILHAAARQNNAA